MKWYYWLAIGVGALVAYSLFLGPKSSVSGNKGTGTGTGWGGILNGAGVAANGLANLWGKVAGSGDDKADSSTSTTAEIAE